MKSVLVREVEPGSFTPLIFSHDVLGALETVRPQPIMLKFSPVILLSPLCSPFYSK